MRIIVRFEKLEASRFVSHLDVQRLFQRALRRADIPMAYSQGFNPHPLISFATALSLGATSKAEWLDIKLAGEVEPEVFIERVNAALPSGFKVVEARLYDDALPSLSALMCAASYTVRILDQGSAQDIRAAIEELMSGPILVQKRTKAGMREVDIRPQVHSISLNEQNEFVLTGELTAAGSLNIDLFMGALFEKFGKELGYGVHRDTIYSFDGTVMPKAWRTDEQGNHR